MAYISIDVDLKDFSDDDIFDEYHERGLGREEEEDDLNLDNAIYEYRRGNVKEALIYLERYIPALAGISEKVS